jgi:steroid delta-isomerase-like uncharacterized protein
VASETTKELVMRLWYRELWDSWNLGVADALFHDDYRLHVSGVPVALDRDGARAAVAMYGKAFPDLKHTVHEILAEGDAVAARWTVHGTHTGDFQGLPPTGRSVAVDGTTIHHVRDGRLVETWLTMDTAQMLQQLGVQHT